MDVNVRSEGSQRASGRAYQIPPLSVSPPPQARGRFRPVAGCLTDARRRRRGASGAATWIRGVPLVDVP